jgi:DNA-binding response OmpR family regulator
MKTRDESLSALLLGEYDDDRLLIYEVFREARWKLYEARDWKRGQHSLDRDRVQVVISRCEFPGSDWKKVLQSLLAREYPPKLIVTSCTADEHLWSEVLSCGGYDVLAEPFHRDEVERVVAAARRHYGPHQPRAGGSRLHSSVA